MRSDIQHKFLTFKIKKQIGGWNFITCLFYPLNLVHFKLNGDIVFCDFFFKDLFYPSQFIDFCSLFIFVNINLYYGIKPLDFIYISIYPTVIL